MALAFADRVRETTTTTGTGTITLAGAVTGYQSFSAIGNGNTTYYTINAGSQWEVGIGTYTASGTTLSRDTVLSSSNAGALVNFSAGTKDVFVGYPAGKVVIQDASGNVGIGTLSPTEKLVLNSAGNVQVATKYINGNTTGVTIGAGADGSAFVYQASALPFIVYTNATERLSVNSSGNVTANVDIRAPIFYDSANTAYYLDPTGSTSLNVAGNMLASGNLTLNNGANRYVRIGSATNYSYDLQTTGDDFQIIEAGTTPRLTIKYPNGYVGIGATAPAERLQVGGNIYIPNGTSNTGALVGYLSSDNFATNGVTMPTYGLKWAGPSDSAGINGFFSSYYGLRFFTGNSERMRIESSGNVTATVDVRAPIFYDSNDTSRYLDPSSTSVISNLTMANSGPVLVLKDTDSTGAAQIGYISFQDSGSAERAWFGYGSTGDTILYMRNSVGYNYLFADYTEASGSLRAPIFYDSNDTAYYIDAAGNNVLNTLYFRTGSVQAKFAQASYFGYSSSYRTVVLGNESLTTISMGVDVISNASGSFNGGGEGREIIFRNGVNFITPNSANNSYLYPFSMADGYAYSTGSFRAPIFYDTDNTGYYVDPASTSNLNALTLAGTINIAGVYGRSAAGIGYLSGGYNGVETNSTTGPIYCISTSYAPTSTTLASMYGIGYTDAGSAGVWSGGGWGMYAAAGGVARVFLDASNGIIYSTASVRSPIFYDSNDTNYFLDPNSTSVLSTVRASTIQFSSGNTAIVLNNASYQILYDPTARPAIYLGGADPGNYYDNTGHYFRNRSGTQYASITASGMFAPIFYDSDDTGRYVDPAGTSTLYTLLVNNGLGVYDSSNNDPYGKLSVTRSSGANYTYLGFTRSGQTAMGMGIDTSNAFWIGGTTAGYDGTRVSTWISITPSGNVTAPVDIRAPIFYDSSNTGYYLDPASTSLTYRMGAYYLQNNADVSDDHPFGLYFSSGLSTAYAIFRESGAWTHPYPDLRIAFHTGIKMGANASYGGMKFYTDYDMSSQVMSINNSADGLGGGNVFVNSSLVAASSLRAPIFYDTDNTGYYVNPAGTSYVSGEFQVQQSSINGIRLLSTTGTQSLWIRAGYDTDGSATPVVSATNIQFQSSGSSGGSFTFVSGNTKALTITGDYAQGAASLRAPIFYDSNNTGFYIDAASTSNINQLNGNGKIVLETFDSFLRINQYNGFSNGIWMGPSNIGGSGELHLGSNGTPSTARVRVIGGTYNGSVVITLNGADGSITAAGNVTAYSDIRVKDNVETVPAALAKLSAIRGVTYTRTDLDDKERRYAGVIAQEIEQVLPEAVREINDIKTVDYNATIALLIQAVKELSAKVEALEAKEY